MDVYRERSHLVAYLAARYESSIAFSDPEEPDWPVVTINTPEGQMTWHLSREDLDLFPHVRRLPILSAEKWDGHTTEEKYSRLLRLTAAEKGRTQ